MVSENISKVRDRISYICSKINRDPNSINIVAISKERTVEQIREAIVAGITDIGENRVQEATGKYDDMRDAMSDKQLKWHMVGHLQTNKAKVAVKIFDLIQSVDSLRVAFEIDRQAAKINKVQDILVEVNTSSFATKFGIKSNEAIEIIKEIAKLKNIKIKGLMTIAPLVDNPEKTRPHFRMLREIRDKINELNEQNGLNELNVLSMGMTDDFAVAVEEGSNMVRLGRAIFEG